MSFNDAVIGKWLCQNCSYDTVYAAVMQKTPCIARGTRRVSGPLPLMFTHSPFTST